MLQPFEPGAEAAWLADFKHCIEIRPRYCETDQVGHVSNTSYGLYLEQGRLAYTRDAKIDDRRGRLKLDHVPAEITVRFVAPCYYDQPLRLYTRCIRMGRSSIELEQAIVDDDGNVKTIARTVAVSYDFETDRSRPWSEAQRAGVRALEGRDV